MLTFHIKGLNNSLRPALQQKIDSLAKPKGSLGRLENLAMQIGLIQNTLTPKLTNPVNVIFAADHGIADEGVSQSPKEVTRQVVFNFLHGGSGVCFLARQHGFGMKIVDGGVDYDFPPLPGLINKKIRKGTRNFLKEPALTQEEMEQAFQAGADIVSECHAEGSNIISFGEMGIGNTSAASMWMAAILKRPVAECVGAGSGLDEEGVRHKTRVLQRAMNRYSGSTDPFGVMRHFGGIEMIMAVGGMLRAAELGMIILIDGFIMTNCYLAAFFINPFMREYCIFCHCGGEKAHRKLLNTVCAEPLLDLGLRLGEGSGAVCAYPLVDSAVRMLNEMHSFEQENITKYF